MRRRNFISLPLLAAAGTLARGASATQETAVDAVKLFLCGDVMTGRGIDQILPHPSSPEIFEPYMTSAKDYVTIAERANGAIPRGADFSYPWGDALAALNREQPDVRIINLETAVTTSDDAWPRKGINYRMHPANTPCLTAAGIDCCVLANNHVIDWGYDGLHETLQTLHRAGIQTVGAGANIAEAMAPAIIEPGAQRRVVVFSMGHASSGIGRAWAATGGRAGVWLLPDLSMTSVEAVARQVKAVRRPGDIVVVSIHWGGNWGYDIEPGHRRFAHALIDHAGVDLLHGHSSHHPRGIEVYHGKLILYGCGDFLNDYEGIGGNEAFRGDLTLMYLPVIDPADGHLRQMTLHALQTHRFRLRQATQSDLRWLAATLKRESAKLDTRVDLEQGTLRVTSPATDTAGFGNGYVA